MIYELANEVMTIKGNNKVLMYNYFAHKLCIINNTLYEKLRNGVLDCSDEVTDKLLRNAIIYFDEKEYLNMDYSKEHIKQCAGRRNDVKCIYFHVTQKCNLKCSYCYNADNLNKKSKELSFEDIVKIITKFSECGGEKVILTGGEALTRNDIVDIARFVKNIDLKCELLTNGTFLNTKRDILEYLDNIIISLDTLKRNKNQRKGLDIDALIDMLKKIPIKYRKKISIRSVISSDDLESWKQIKAFCKKNKYSFIPNLYIPNSIEEETLIPNDRTMIEPKNFELNANYCGAGYAEVAIDSDGKIYPCQTLVKDKFKIAESIYDYYDQKVIDLFKNRRLDLIGECKECEYKYLCGGGCPSISYNLYGDLYTAPKPLCKHFKYAIDKKLEHILLKYE